MALLALRRFELVYSLVGKSEYYNWVLNGLREFWEIATILKLAAMAISKQYCLTPSEVSGELYCVGKLQNSSPKILCSLDLSLVAFFASRQRK